MIWYIKKVVRNVIIVVIVHVNEKGDFMKKFLAILFVSIIITGTLYFNKKAISNPVTQCYWNFTEVHVSVQGVGQNKFLAGTSFAKCGPGISVTCEPVEITFTAVNMATGQSYTDTDLYTGKCGKNEATQTSLFIPNNVTYGYSFMCVGTRSRITYFNTSGFITLE